MIISATEFQQNVGYYFKLVDAGEEVIIEKRRPKAMSYQLVRSKIEAKKQSEVKLKKNKKLLEELREGNENLVTEWNDSVEFQRWVRN